VLQFQVSDGVQQALKMSSHNIQHIDK